MKFCPTKKILAAATAALLALGLAGCGGGGGDGGDLRPAPRPHEVAKFDRLVSFGDSLSDVGTYRVSTIATLGGGRFTINGPGARIWTEQLAERLGTDQPCAAQTGLESTIPTIPPAPVQDRAGCWSFAQGGARVRHPVGPNNKALVAGTTQPTLGALTRPVSDQIARYLAASNSRFNSRDLVTVWAGANDLFMELAALSATVGAGGNATQAAATALQAMTAAGTDLAGQVTGTLLAQGASRVVVLTLPDVSRTPKGLAQDAQTRALMQQMVQSFNSALAAGLRGEERVLLVDIHARSTDQADNPAKYGIGNLTTPACDESRLVLPSSLVCTQDTLIAGDLSSHFYADDVHPTPFGYRLVSDFVLEQLKARSWL